MSDPVSVGLKVDVESVGDRAVVAVSGELDVLTSGLFAGVVDAAIGAGCRDLAVDFGEVTFIDATALRVIVGASLRLREIGGVFTVHSASARVRRVLDITGVSELVHSATAPDRPRRSGEPAAGTAGGSSREPDLAGRPSNVRSRSTSATVDAALRLVTALADTTVANAEGVSVTLERHGRLMTVAASDDAVKEMDRHQYETGEGPCLAAKDEGRKFYIESLAEETRWPKFVPLALQQGIHSILSSPLTTKNRPQGALNIYSTTERAFDTRQQQLAAWFADQASEILTTADPDLTDEQIAQRFARALLARQVIHQAQGVVMERQGLTPQAAVRALHRTARAAGVNVADYATAVVNSVRRADRES